MNAIYISPNLNIHSTFGEATTHDEEDGLTTRRSTQQPINISMLTLAKRNLIVGEPGTGKTSLLYAIKEHLKKGHCATEFVSLKQRDCKTLIEEFLKTSSQPRALLLDGLDEIQSSLLFEVLHLIEGLPQRAPDLQVYVTSRWVFAAKHHISLPEFRYISLSPFSNSQVREYLTAAGHTETKIGEILDHVSSFRGSTNILQIPRYLHFLNELLKKERGATFEKGLTRNEIFEKFVYSALEVEDKKAEANKRAITKRLLEKLALTMEIYQTSVISQDELMTFFDEISSELKVVALANFNLDELYDRSILKVTNDTIEFDNREFQEYLAAKEISRLSNPNRSAFSFSVDPYIREIYPSWLNTLSFLVDMRVDFLGQLIEYSGIRSPEYKVIDSEFLSFIVNVNPLLMSREMQRQLFKDVITYHETVSHWFPWDLPRPMARFYDPSLEVFLKSSAEAKEAGGQRSDKEIVRLGNACRILAVILEADAEIDRPYWREKLVAFASATEANDVLQRSALHALEMLNDASVINDLPNLVGSTPLVTEAFVDMCATIGPNNPKSVGYFIDTVSHDNFHGRYGLYKLNTLDSLKQFLDAFNKNTNFRTQFLNQQSIFSEGEDGALIDNLGLVFNEEIANIAKETLRVSLNHQIHYGPDDSGFVLGLWRLLHNHDDQFLISMVNELDSKKSENPGAFYYSQPYFATVLKEEEVATFIGAMINVDQSISAFQIMLLIKDSDREDSLAIYEKGRDKLHDLYSESENRDQSKKATVGNQDLSAFRKKLHPEPGKFDHSVFSFLNQRKDTLLQCLEEQDKEDLKQLINDTVLKLVNPIEASVTIVEESPSTKRLTYSTAIPLFGSALITAQLLGLDTTHYRKKIIDFIPFANSESLKEIFDILGSVEPNEWDSVINVYKDRTSDLWRYEPLNFVDAVERFHIDAAIPILKLMVSETAYDRRTRVRALIVLDSIASDSDYLREIFQKYENSGDAGERLREVANAILITSYADANAVRWRLSAVRSRYFPYIDPQTVHVVDEDERELWSRSFAKPLLELKRTGFETDYLDLLDTSIELWSKGVKFERYAQYLWDITYTYFENLKDEQTYEPLKQIETKISSIQNKAGANWLAVRLADLRRLYLSVLGKPRHISEAIRKYNIAREFDDRKITNAEDLFRQVQETLDIELRHWIEGEGAYHLIGGPKVFDSQRQPYEELIQKTLKAQVETILHRKGFQIDLIREPQLYSNKRVDILLRHGFAGPIIIEIKLTSNTDLKVLDIASTVSHANMVQYMKGYGATHGFFVVINNNPTGNLERIKQAYETIPNVFVHSFNCLDVSQPKASKKPRPKRSKSRKK